MKVWNRGFRLTWLGHSAFELVTRGGKIVLFDPWLTGNPKTPDALRAPAKADLIALSHAHGDHASDVPELAARLGCPVVCGYEVHLWLEGDTGTRALLDRDLAREAIRSLVALRDELAPAEPVPLGLLAAVPDLFVAGAPTASDELRRATQEAVEHAMTVLDGARRREGDALAHDLVARLATVRTLAARVGTHAPEALALMAFTAGDAPRAVAYTHRRPAAQHEALARVLPGRSGDKDLPGSPLDVLHNLASGIPCVLPEFPFLRRRPLVLETAPFSDSVFASR